MFLSLGGTQMEGGFEELERKKKDFQEVFKNFLSRKGLKQKSQLPNLSGKDSAIWLLKLESCFQENEVPDEYCFMLAFEWLKLWDSVDEADFEVANEIEEKEIQEIRVSYPKNLGKMEKHQEIDEEVQSEKKNKIAEMVAAGVESGELGVRVSWWEEMAMEEGMDDRDPKKMDAEGKGRKKMEGIDAEGMRNEDDTTKIEEAMDGNQWVPAPVTEAWGKRKLVTEALRKTDRVLGLGENPKDSSTQLFLTRFSIRPEPKPNNQLACNPNSQPKWPKPISNQITFKLNPATLGQTHFQTLETPVVK